MPLTKVSHKFQVVIPKEIRELLCITKGDTLEVYGKNHEVIMKKLESKKSISLRILRDSARKSGKTLMLKITSKRREKVGRLQANRT